MWYNLFVVPLIGIMWRRIEAVITGRTRNHLDQMEGSCPVTLDFTNLFSNPGFMHSLFALQFALQL